MQNVIIFGTGEFGKYIYKAYNTIYNIQYFCDNDANKHNQLLFNIEIIAPNQLKKLVYDKIIIASSYSSEIYSQLINEFNIDESKLIQLYSNQSKAQFYSSDKLKKTEQFMFDICQILNTNKIQHYLDHGTLLGIIRDNALIPWDKDVDIAVLATDKDKIIALLNDFLPTYNHPYCRQNNWKYIIANDLLMLDGNETNEIMELQINNESQYLDDEVALDLMFKYLQGDTLHWGVCGKHLESPLSICLPTATVTFKSHQFNIPKDHIQYLKNMYGNWQEKIKDWSYDQYSNIKKGT